MNNGDALVNDRRSSEIVGDLINAESDRKMKTVPSGKTDRLQ